MKTCKECGGTYYAKDYCIKHYFKSRRTTTRELIAEDAQCTLEGCDKRPVAKGLCKYHYERKRKGLAPTAVRKEGSGTTTKEVVGYRGAHIRVSKAKGKASTHDCTYPNCDKPASEWALDPLAVHTYEDEQGRVWSLNINDYIPLCRKHHRLMDGQPDEWYIDLWLEGKV